ncbi:putative isomerase YddE [bioreactor metagenome]|uniref:Putative isomerase YddE n=1 Tax=bioreactor metagenome TaxID=1076179 RepID=A0A644WHA4_9ZZZZ
MKYYVIDAFADELFRGNPAGVCIMDRELSDEMMQKIAFENNLPETAFLLKKEGKYILRWFTPEVEIDLCGHATLATAWVLMNEIEASLREVSFQTQSGILTVRRENDVFIMDFPSRKPRPVPVPSHLEKALGCKILEAHLSRDLLVLVDNERDVSNLAPDLGQIREITSDLSFAMIVTAKGDTCDFVSRFFAPNAGIPEDPVTGSSHSTLIPFWSERLGKSKMLARQLSRRGGTLYCQDRGERVLIGGTAVCYLKGIMNL